MPWPPTLSDGQLVTTAWLNSVAQAPATWQGQVNANGYSVVNMAGLTLPSLYAINSIGVGTSSPSAQLHVVGASGNPLLLESSAASVAVSFWCQAASNSIAVDSAGSLYIGGSGSNKNIYVRNTDGGWGVQALFEGATKRVYLYGLPSSQTGLSSGALWYDPSDGNRVKYVP